MRQKISAQVNGGLSGGSRVRRPESEDPHWCTRKLRVHSYSFGNKGQHVKFQSPRTTPSGRTVEFTPNYIIEGGEAGILEIILR